MDRHLIRFGLVGCGRISRFHIDAVRAAGDDAGIVSVCDIDSSKARDAAEKIGGKIRVFSDLESMLAQGGLDCVSICTPSGLHPVHGSMAAESGCHVVTEKPIGIDIPATDRLLDACDKNHRRLFVVLQNRLNPTVRLMRDALEQGRFGRIYMGQANVFWTRPQSYYDGSPWRGTRAMDGGAFMNQASHYVDLMQWMMGEPVEVTALTGTLGRRIEAEDTGSAVVRFASGAFGSINVTMLVYPSNLEGSMTLMGEKGTARIGGIALNQVEKWDFSTSGSNAVPADQAGYQPSTVYGNGHTGWYRNVIDELKYGRSEDPARIPPDGPEGKKSIKLILAIYESARTGRPVRL